MTLITDNYTKLIKEMKRTDKVEISFIGEREYLYSGWEINQITSHLNNYYYKHELVNTIKSYLRSGVKPQNIFVMNNSVKISNAYTKYEEGKLNLDDESDLLNFYYLGSPVAYKNNPRLQFIYSSFELTRRIVSMIDSYSSISINKSGVVFELIKNQNEISSEAKLRELILNLLTIKKVDSKKNELDEIIKKLKKLYITWEEILKKYNSNDDILNEEQNDFIYIFKRYDKPIVCVYNEDNNSIEILCIDMIAMKFFDENNARLLETKEIKQNSPLIITIGIAVTFLPSIIKVAESLISSGKTKRELIKQENKLDNEIENYEKKIGELEKKIDENNRILQSISDDNIIQNNNDKPEIVESLIDINNLDSELQDRVISVFKEKKLVISYVDSIDK